MADDSNAPRYQASTTVEIGASRERVWQVLTEPGLVKRYLHDTDLQTDWSLGGRIVWRGEWQGRQYEDKGQVRAFDPPTRLSVTHWSPLTGDPDTPDNYHHLTYELEQLGEGRTRLTLTQGNSPSPEAAEAMIENGWRPVLESLKQVAESSRT
jgi:uncharacterized protein YndB with AHSA1/START domain